MGIFKNRLRAGLIATLSLGAIAASNAAPITPGNLVLTRVGDGAAALTSAATAVFLDEYTTAGVLVQSIAVPTSVSGANFALTVAGTSTSEGGITISPNGQFVTFAGYNAAAGTAGITATTSAANVRVVGILDLASGSINSSTALTGAFSAGNPRSAVTDGTNVWAVGSNSGVQYTTVGSVAVPTQIAAAPTNLRRIEIFNGQLYVSSGSGTFVNVSAVGTGTPTTTGQTVTTLSGFPTAVGPSPYDFYFSDANTVYVADDRATALGGLQKWTMSAGSWSLAYTINPAAATGLRGLTGVVSGGVTTVYATGTNNTLVSLTDTGATSAFSVIATAATNTAFRGIEFAPFAAVPEPGSLALLGLALLPGAALLLRRRTK